MEEEVFTEREFHRKMAVKLFNLSWDLMDTPDDTPAGRDRLLNAAHASRYHWEQVGTAENLMIGEWQLSRVYAVLKRPEPALYHANRCLELCEQNNADGFKLAYAYEAIARAHALAGKSDVAQYISLALSVPLEDEETTNRLKADLNTIVQPDEASAI